MRGRKRSDPPDPEASHEFVSLFAAEVDHQLQAEQHTTTALSTRAALLITATGLLALSRPEFESHQVFSILMHVVSVFLGIGAGICGVYVLFTRTGQATDLRDLWNTHAHEDADQASAAISFLKIDVLEARRKANAMRARVVRRGFILMLSAVACAAISFCSTI